MAFALNQITLWMMMMKMQPLMTMLKRNLLVVVSFQL